MGIALFAYAKRGQSASRIRQPKAVGTLQSSSADVASQRRIRLWRASRIEDSGSDGVAESDSFRTSCGQHACKPFVRSGIHNRHECPYFARKALLFAASESVAGVPPVIGTVEVGRPLYLGLFYVSQTFLDLA